MDAPRSRLEAQGELFDEKKAHRDDFRNLLIWGDNKPAMASLLEEFRGRVRLIYIDPPFDVGADFTMKVPLGDGKEMAGKEPSILEQVAYRDTWGRGTDSYLHMMCDRLSLMRELLAEDGSIYVHCDWRVNSMLRLVMDEVFGKESFQNQILWSYRTGGSSKRRFSRKHDVILFYSKGEQWIFHVLKEKSYTKSQNRRPGIINYGGGEAEFFEDKEGVYNLVNMSDVWELSYIGSTSPERTGYPTQKPEALLDRIIRASSNEGDIVADFFCGSGTTGAVAERLGRRWIMTDLGRFAVHTSRKRLLDLQRTLHEGKRPYRSFDVFNVGRYERSWWQKEALDGADGEHRRVVLRFFGAAPLNGTPPSPLLHGHREGALVHVDGIDGNFTRKEARAVARAVRSAGGRSAYCLAWEFEMDMLQIAEAIEAELGVRLLLRRIPREIMERNREPPLPFHEPAHLAARAVYRTNGRGAAEVDIALERFLPSLADVPVKELEALRARAAASGFDFIDFWAVDFDWSPSKPFRHHWQDYRTRGDRTLKTVSDAAFSYPGFGSYTACVKVVDVFGFDTSATVDVEVVR